MLLRFQFIYEYLKNKVIFFLKIKKIVAESVLRRKNNLAKLVSTRYLNPSSIFYIVAISSSTVINYLHCFF